MLRTSAANLHDALILSNPYRQRNVMPTGLYCLQKDQIGEILGRKALQEISLSHQQACDFLTAEVRRMQQICSVA